MHCLKRNKTLIYQYLSQTFLILSHQNFHWHKSKGVFYKDDSKGEVGNSNLVSTFCYLSLEWELGDFLHSGGIHRFFGWSFNFINYHYHCNHNEKNKSSPVAENACIKRARFLHCNMLFCCRPIKHTLGTRKGNSITQ